MTVTPPMPTRVPSTTTTNGGGGGGSSRSLNTNDIPSLDLHGDTESTAIWRVTNFLEQHSHDATVKIITGTGSHSRQGPVLRNAVERLLRKRKMQFRRNTPGSVLVQPATGITLFRPNPPEDTKVIVRDAEPAPFGLSMATATGCGGAVGDGRITSVVATSTPVTNAGSGATSSSSACTSRPRLMQGIPVALPVSSRCGDESIDAATAQGEASAPPCLLTSTSSSSLSMQSKFRQQDCSNSNNNNNKHEASTGSVGASGGGGGGGGSNNSINSNTTSTTTRWRQKWESFPTPRQLADDDTLLSQARQLSLRTAQAEKRLQDQDVEALDRALKQSQEDYRNEQQQEEELLRRALAKSVVECEICTREIQERREAEEEFQLRRALAESKRYASNNEEKLSDFEWEESLRLAMDMSLEETTKVKAMNGEYNEDEDEEALIREAIRLSLRCEYG